MREALIARPVKKNKKIKKFKNKNAGKFYLAQISANSTKVVVVQKKDRPECTGNSKVRTLTDKNHDGFGNHYQKGYCLKAILKIEFIF